MAILWADRLAVPVAWLSFQRAIILDMVEEAVQPWPKFIAALRINIDSSLRSEVFGTDVHYLTGSLAHLLAQFQANSLFVNTLENKRVLRFSRRDEENFF